MIKFLKKGVKDSKGNYCPVWYSHSKEYGKRGTELKEVVVVYAKNYKPFPEEVAKSFEVIDNTDITIDHFEHERIVIETGHPLFNSLIGFCVK